MACEIMTTGLALAALFDEFHPYPLIFSTAVDRLVRRLVVHEKALEKDRKDRGGFYEKNIEFMGLGSSASKKSLKLLN